MGDYNNKVSNVYGAFVIMIVILLAVPYVFHSVAYRGNTDYITNENKQEIHVFDTTEMESTLKMYFVKDAYKVDGTKYYIAKFREDLTSAEFECHIPGEYVDALSRDATYDCNVELVYLVNDYNRQAGETKKLVYENGSLTGEIDTNVMRRTAHTGKSTTEYIGNTFGVEINSIDFMFKEFMVTEFNCDEKLAEHQETYKDVEITFLNHEVTEEGSSNAN